MSPRVSIVIPVFNRVDLTTACLVSLVEHTPDDLYEVIVVDNGSSDGTAELLAGLEGDVTVLTNATNTGFGEACNQGAAVARGEYVLFLNNDTVLLPGWLPPLVTALDEDDRRGAVQPRLVYPDGRLNDAGGLVFADGEAWVYGKGDDPELPEYLCRRGVDYASGACLLVRRKAFLDVGGFDGRYAPAYYEDTDLSFALRAAGWSVLYEPGSTVVHVEGGTAGTDTSVGLKRFQPRNKVRFTEKWAEDLRARPGMDPAVVRRWAHRGLGGFGPGERRDGDWETARALSAQSLRVLVMDAFPPMPDRASGSLRTSHIVRSLRRAGHAVTFCHTVVGDFDAYRRRLGDQGVPLLTTTTGEELARVLQQHQPHLVLLSPWALAEQALPVVRLVAPEARVAVDSCDLHFLREERAARLSAEPSDARTAADTARRELAVYAAADRVICVSAAEEAELRRRSPSAAITVIGNAHEEVGTGPDFAARSGLLFVGNSNHTPNVDAVEWWAREIAPRLAHRLPGVRLTVVGNDPVGRYQRFASDLVDVVGWVPDTLPHLHAARLSVAPLRFGAGVKGKVGEALMAGLPVVGTSMAVEGMGLTDGAECLVADDAEAFVTAVVRAYTDAALWSSLRQAGRAAVRGTSSVTALDAAVDSLVRSTTAALPAPEVAAPAPATISVVLNVRNEERKLPAALASCSGADDLVVADMESTDATRDIASAAGARVLRLPHVGYCEPGRQPAIDAARGEWVLVLDADERLTEDGLQRLRELAGRTPATVSAYRLERPNHIGATEIRATGWGVDVERHARFFRKADVTWPTTIHAVPTFTGHVLDCPKELGVRLHHDAFDSLEHAISKFNRYSTVEAQERVQGGGTSTPADALTDAVQEFTRRYSPEVDGSVSFALSMGIFAYRFLVHAKTQELSGWPTRALPERASMQQAWQAFLTTLAEAEHAEARAGALKHHQAGDLDAAAAELGEACDAWGPHAQTLSDLAVVETGRGDLPAAWAAAQHAVTLDPTDEDARFNRWCLAVQLGHAEAPRGVALSWDGDVPDGVLRVDEDGAAGALRAALSELPLAPASLDLVLVSARHVATTAGPVLDEVAALLAPGGRVVLSRGEAAGDDVDTWTASLRHRGMDVHEEAQAVVGTRPRASVPDGTASTTAYPTDAPPCPLCGGHDLEHLFRAARQGDEVWRCACGIVTYWPRKTGEDLLDHYDEAYVHEGDGHGYAGGYVAAEEETAQRMRAFAFHRALPEVLESPTDELLDVGAATGVFVELALQAGLRARGVEPSEAAVRVAAERGRPVALGTVADMAPGSADVLTLWDVIEHVDTPVELLRECRRVLRPGGRLVVRTQDVESPQAAAAGEHWEQFITAHVVHFSTRTLARALTAAGFESVREVDREGYMTTVVATAPRPTTALAAGGLATVRAPFQRVNLACGDDRRPGWLNVDAHTAADLTMDLRHLTLPPGSVDELLLSHALEHFSETEFRQVLTECRRVLRPDGRLLVNVPDLEWVLSNWLSLPEPDRWDWALATVFGLQDNPGEFHRTGFSAARLSSVLREAGFGGVRVVPLFSHGQGCLWAEASPSRLPDTPRLSVLLSPSSADDVTSVMDWLRTSAPADAELVVAERAGTAATALAAADLRMTWLRNTDPVEEADGIAQAACVAKSDLVLPVLRGRRPSLEHVRDRRDLATVPAPSGRIPDCVRDWRLAPSAGR